MDYLARVEAVSVVVAEAYGVPVPLLLPEAKFV